MSSLGLPIKGRGSASRPAGRFEAQTVAVEDDGWAGAEEALETEPRLDTTVREERARTIISHNTSPDVGFSQSVNGYRGCERAAPLTS